MRHSMGATEMFNYCHHTLLTGHFTLFGIAVEPIQLTQLFGQSKHRRDEAVVVWGQTCHCPRGVGKKTLPRAGFSDSGGALLQQAHPPHTPLRVFVGLKRGIRGAALDRGSEGFFTPLRGAGRGGWLERRKNICANKREDKQVEE